MIRISRLMVCLSLLTLPAGNLRADELPPLKTVPKVDLARYVGKWYEIARFPNSFQKDCNEATAEYTVIDSEKIEVVNRCKELGSGKPSSVTGVAKIEDRVNFTKLKVNFVPSWLRWTGVGNGDYWVIGLDEGYTYAVVSEPKRKYLWILSRTPELPKATYEAILKQLKEQGFDAAQLIPSR